MKTHPVLLVLEEPLELIRYGTFFRDQGYEVLTCASLEESLNSLDTESVSLVVVSQDTPAFEGRKVLQRSRHLHPEVPVLVVARVLNMHCYLEAMELGAADYLERPELRDLEWVVETQLFRSQAAKFSTAIRGRSTSPELRQQYSVAGEVEGAKVNTTRLCTL